VKESSGDAVALPGGRLFLKRVFSEPLLFLNQRSRKADRSLFSASARIPRESIRKIN
jgi:hypothetical protein